MTRLYNVHIQCHKQLILNYATFNVRWSETFYVHIHFLKSTAYRFIIMDTSQRDHIQSSVGSKKNKIV